MREYKNGDMFWAIHRKLNNEEVVGVARKRSYGWEFNTVERIKEGKSYETVYSHNLTSIEDSIHPKALDDLIDFAIDCKDEEWFISLCEVKKTLS
jgi:hypothetical protein